MPHVGKVVGDHDAERGRATLVRRRTILNCFDEARNRRVEPSTHFIGGFCNRLSPLHVFAHCYERFRGTSDVLIQRDH